MSLVFFVIIETLMQDRLFFRMINQAIFVASIGESAGDAQSSYGIQPICVLHHFSFKRFHRCWHPRSLVRDTGDDFDDWVNHPAFHMVCSEELFRHLRAFVFVPVVKLPISNIVEQGG